MYGMMPFVALVFVSGQVAPQPATARLVAQAIAARGKPDVVGDVVRKVAGVQKETFRGEATTSATFVRESQGANRGRNELRWFEGGQEMSRVLVWDKPRYKVSHNGGPFMPFTQGQTAASEEGIHLSIVCHLDSLTDQKRFVLELLPNVDAAGEACDRVRVKCEGRPDIDLCFSTKTHLLRQWSMRQVCPDEKHRQVVEVLSAYKTFSGVTMATVKKLSMGEGFMVQEDTIESVEFLPADRAGDLFTRP